MGTIHSYTAEHMDEILDEVIQSAAVIGGHLILTFYGGDTADLGDIRGPQGIQGPGGTITSVNGKTGSAVVLDLATAIAAGTILLASSAEVIAGTDAAKAVTASTLATLTGTTARRGLLELSDDTEMLAGTDTARVPTVAQVQRGLRRVQTLRITATGITAFVKATYPWLRAINVVCIGAGGGGGGAAVAAASNASIGGSGGGGEYSTSMITDIAGLAASVDMTVGVGGTAGASGVPATAGGTGGDSSFGTAVIAKGGGGGSNGVTGAAGAVGPTPGIGGTGGTGDFKIPGEAATPSPYISTVVVAPGLPGEAPFYGARPAITAKTVSSAGVAGAGYGSGGVGAANPAAGVTAAGAAGSAGLIIVELFA